MSRKYNKSNIFIETGGSGMLDGTMPVDGTEPLRSFADGTGRRKYAKNDPAVARMRSERAKSYRKYGIGATGVIGAGSGIALTRSEMLERGLLKTPSVTKRKLNRNVRKKASKLPAGLRSIMSSSNYSFPKVSKRKKR